MVAKQVMRGAAEKRRSTQSCSLILHTGAHYTEQERLIKTLLRNKEMLSQRGVHVPGPGTYRALIRDTLNAMHRAPAAADAREVLMDVIMDDVTANRVILSDPNFFRTAGTAIQEGVIYPAGPKRMAHMAELFPDDELEIYLAIRNPAGLVPVLYNVAVEKQDEKFWGHRRPHDLRWSEPLHTSVRPHRRSRSTCGATKICR